MVLVIQFQPVKFTRMIETTSGNIHTIGREKLVKLKSLIHLLSLNNRMASQSTPGNKLQLISDVVIVLFGKKRFFNLIRAYQSSQISNINAYANEVNTFKNFIDYLISSKETEVEFADALQKFKVASGLWDRGIEA